MTKYDDVDWHTRGTHQSWCRPHIGIYLAWLVKMDLLIPGVVGESIADLLDRRVASPLDLCELVDGKIESDLMTESGAAFTAKVYEPEYLPAARDLVEPDRTSDRPGWAWAKFDELSSWLDARWAALGLPFPAKRSKPEARVETVQLAGAGPALPPDLVERVAWVAGDARSELAPLFRKLGPVPGTQVASTVVGQDRDAVGLSLYRVPAVSPLDVAEALMPWIHLDSGARWTNLESGDRQILFAEGPTFAAALWATERNIVVYAAGFTSSLRAFVEALVNRR